MFQGKTDYEFDCAVKQDDQGHIVNVHGYSALILQTLRDVLHFRYSTLFYVINPFQKNYIV